MNFTVLGQYLAERIQDVRRILRRDRSLTTRERTRLCRRIDRELAQLQELDRRIRQS
jgi:hypothetical protein